MIIVVQKFGQKTVENENCEKKFFVPFFKNWNQKDWVRGWREIVPQIKIPCHVNVESNVYQNKVNFILSIPTHPAYKHHIWFCIIVLQMKQEGRSIHRPNYQKLWKKSLFFYCVTLLKKIIELLIISDCGNRKKIQIYQRVKG